MIHNILIQLRHDNILQLVSRPDLQLGDQQQRGARQQHEGPRGQELQAERHGRQHRDGHFQAREWHAEGNMGEGSQEGDIWLGETLSKTSFMINMIH